MARSILLVLVLGQEYLRGMANVLRLQNGVRVSKDHGEGIDITVKPDRTVLYTGRPEVITL